MKEKIKLLVVDDEVRFLKTLTQRLSLRDFDVTPVTAGHEAVKLAKKQEFDLALVDLKMPGMAGEEVLEILKSEHPYMEVIILTGHGSIDSAINCTRGGAYSYLQKPCETEELLEVLKNAYQKRMQRKWKVGQDRLEALAQIALGESPLGILHKLKELEVSGSDLLEATAAGEELPARSTGGAGSDAGVDRREAVRVADLMLSLDEYATINAEASIQEALVALNKAQMGLTYDRHHHRAILVLDKKSRVVGKLTHWAILNSLDPKFFNQTDHQNLERTGLSSEFISRLEQQVTNVPISLEKMCETAARVRVKDAMVPVRESIEEDAPLTKAIRMLVLGRWQSVLVTRRGEVVGILRLADVFEEVADLIRRCGGGK